MLKRAFEDVISHRWKTSKKTPMWDCVQSKKKIFINVTTG
jgi:hypothetical protein